MSVTFVPSDRNKVNALTRVKKSWLKVEKAITATCRAGRDEVKELHGLHHVGVGRTLYLVRKVYPEVSRDTVQKVVRSCDHCQSIDPSPNVHELGEIQVDTNWTQLSIDVTHYRGEMYLTIVDCGPGRFAIWREIRAATADIIAKELEEIFFERGPVEEVLMDSGAALRSEVFRSMLDKWNTRQYYRAAYRPSGNGIVERNHRTIKVIAERGGISPAEAVFWYNMSPKSGQREDTVPHRAVYSYQWRHPRVVPCLTLSDGPESIRIEEEVWVKPTGARCTTKWTRGMVTGAQSCNNVEVDSMPRHILDLSD
ncbi:unnamed protein product [Acanthosepion pharaonis]|uniref:Integrase catalytic domain-containing protein n=1 Tax=Acanthosepion pharaonis TaxID=158019 RepID=A0A812CM18_ACAPH|nr:unnamed protein product [Sepia pharaonis]